MNRPQKKRPLPVVPLSQKRPATVEVEIVNPTCRVKLNHHNVNPAVVVLVVSGTEQVPLDPTIIQLDHHSNSNSNSNSKYLTEAISLAKPLWSSVVITTPIHAHGMMVTAVPLPIGVIIPWIMVDDCRREEMW